MLKLDYFFFKVVAGTILKDGHSSIDIRCIGANGCNPWKFCGLNLDLLENIIVLEMA